MSSYDPRTIAFAAEILYPPQQLRADQVQTVHNALYRQPAFGYQNFTVAQDGIHLANLPQAPGQISQVSFLPDRLIVREELRSTTVEDFATRVVNVTSVSFQTLGIPATLAQQFVVRSLVQPRHFKDGRDLLGKKLFAQEPEAWQAFGRPLQSLGIRFTFPPVNDHKEMHHVRIETWPHDPRSLWLENTASFTVPIAAENLPQVANALYTTYRFLTGPVGDFLGRFDTP
jgi:hypothetical protein